MPPLTTTSDNESDADSSLGEIPARPKPIETTNGKRKGKAPAVVNGAKDEEEEDEEEEENGDDDDDDEIAEDEYEVEAIEGHKFQRGNLYLRVRWAGYPEEVDKTWESEDNVATAGKIVSEYYESIGGPPAGDSSATKASKKKAAAKSTVEPASKRQKRVKDDEDEVDWTPKGDNWDKNIDDIASLERLPNGNLQVLANFKNGTHARVGTDVAYKKFPQMMLKFYESKL